MRIFLVLLAAAAGCAGSQEVGEAPATAPVVVPSDCEAPKARAVEARPTGGEAMAGAVFALAECEQLRFAARQDTRLGVEAILALYDEASTADLPKYAIGAPIRKADLLRSAGRKDVKELYEKGLGHADGTDKETRLDVDISDWVKAGCKGYKAVGGNERKYRVCNPWKESWR
jgi:hypothetical protein